VEIDAVNRRGRHIRVRVTVSPFLQEEGERSGVVLLMDPTDQ
jgi:two-component system CheB/CheR fusion protein